MYNHMNNSMLKIATRSGVFIKNESNEIVLADNIRKENIELLALLCVKETINAFVEEFGDAICEDKWHKLLARLDASFGDDDKLTAYLKEISIDDDKKIPTPVKEPEPEIDKRLLSGEFNKNFYPTEETLNKIATWTLSGVIHKEMMVELFDYINYLWYPNNDKNWKWEELIELNDDINSTSYEKDYNDRFDRNYNVYKFCTNNWPGNEDIIDALKKNTQVWNLIFREYTRPGGYIFDLRYIPKQENGVDHAED